MQKNEATFISRIPDSVKVAVARWWFAGAMCFMFGWGFGLVGIDAIFLLGIGIGVGHIFVLHPLIYSMFDIERNGKLVNKKYYERTILEGTVVKLGEILKCLFCTMCTAGVYILLSLARNAIFSLDSSEVIGFEPISFGIFFLCFYLLVSKTIDLIAKVVSNIKNKKE